MESSNIQGLKLQNFKIILIRKEMIYTQDGLLTLNAVPGLLVSLLHHSYYCVGWRQQGRDVKSKLQKSAFSNIVESLDIPPE